MMFRLSHKNNVIFYNFIITALVDIHSCVDEDVKMIATFQTTNKKLCSVPAYSTSVFILFSVSVFLFCVFSSL